MGDSICASNQICILCGNIKSSDMVFIVKSSSETCKCLRRREAPSKSNLKVKKNVAAVFCNDVNLFTVSLIYFSV